MVSIIISHCRNFAKDFVGFDKYFLQFIKIIMEKLELKQRKTFYLLGIGGISMSSLAIFLKKMGNSVSGSDITASDTTELLEEKQIGVDFQFCEEHIKEADYVVRSSAIKEDDVNFRTAQALGKRIACRGELLGEIAKQYKHVIAVAGSHGKTTTTAMIYEVLQCAGKNPTLHLGGFRCDDKKNFELGGKDYFVTEACEYHDNFLFLKPYVAVITNVEKEHMDYFKTFENQLLSFEKFRKRAKFVVERDEDFVIKNPRHKKNGHLSFDLFKSGKKLMRLNLNVCEDINAQNCILAYKACKVLELSDEEIKRGLENFKGVKTRFEKVKCQNFDNVLCDYSHHPTEIEKAIYSARKIFKGRKLVVVFQPHTFSRTKDLLEGFVSVLKSVDFLILYKTYSAREKESDGMSAKALAQVLKKHNSSTKYAEDFCELEKILQSVERTTVIMFVGAGDLPAILHKNNFLS